MTYHYTSLTNVEELDAIILSYCAETTLDGLVWAIPDHQLVAPGAQCWYERVARLVGGDAKAIVPYQRPRSDVAPTNYKALWKVLGTSVGSYDIVRATSLDPRVYQIELGQAREYSVLEKVLDAIAVHTREDDATADAGLVLWPPPIVALVVEWIVLTLDRSMRWPRDMDPNGLTVRTVGRILVPGDNDILIWALATAVSRGCAPLITALGQRVGTPVLGDAGADSVRHWVGKIILSGACHMPEWPIPPLTLGPAPTTDAIEAMWSTYCDTVDADETLSSSHTPNVVPINFIIGDADGPRELVQCISSACRDGTLLDAILDTYVRLGLQSQVSIDDMIRFTLHSPCRHVDDYGPVVRILDWYVEHNGVNSAVQHLNSYNHHTMIISDYYAARIRTRGQSDRFVRNPVLRRYLGYGDIYHDAIYGDHGKVWKAVRYVANIPVPERAAIYETLRLVNSYVTSARISANSGLNDTKPIVALLRSEVLKKLLRLAHGLPYYIGVVASYRLPMPTYTGVDWRTNTHYGATVISLILGSAQYLPALEAACDLLDAPLTSTGGTYGGRLHNMPAVVEQLLTAVSLDPYSDRGAIPWLAGRLVRYARVEDVV